MECIVHGVAKSWTRLSGFHFHLYKSSLKCPVCVNRRWEHGGDMILADSFISMTLQPSAVEEEESYLIYVSKGLSPGMILSVWIFPHSSLQILVLFFPKQF